MSDPTPTRQETVEASIEAVEGLEGAGAYKKIWTQLLKDISVSLAMLVDDSSSSST